MGSVHQGGLKQGGLPRVIRHSVALPGVDTGVTPEQVLVVVAKYEAELAPKCSAVPLETASTEFTDIRALSHVLWMCGEIRKYVASGDIERVMRWLGFVQGALWSLRYKTIDEMRDDNR